MDLREKIARAISNGQDVDPDVFIGMHDRRSWERIYYPPADAILQIPEIKEALRRSEYARHAALCNLNQFYDTAEGLKSACVCSCGLDD